MGKSEVSVMEVQQEVEGAAAYSLLLEQQKKGIDCAPHKTFDTGGLKLVERVASFYFITPEGDDIHAKLQSSITLAKDWVTDAASLGLVPDGRSYRFCKASSLLRFFQDVIGDQGGEDDKLLELGHKFNRLFPSLLEEMVAKKLDL